MANYIGIPEAAEQLGVAESTIHRRIERRKITPALVVGKRRYLSPDQLAALSLASSKESAK